MTKRLLSILAAMAMITPAYAVEPLPGDACAAANNLQFTSGPEVSGGGGHAMLCQGGTWKSILSFNSAAGLTKLGNQTCATNEILKFNGTTWACAADGGSLPTLASANIWVGNGSNAATAVAMSGDATISNAGVLTIGSNAVGSAEITNASVALADLSATGTASATTYLRGDNMWATPSITETDPQVGTTTASNFCKANVGGTAIDCATAAIVSADITDSTITGGDIANTTIAVGKLSATGTASATTYLRGDNTWAAASGGGISAVTTQTCSIASGNSAVSCTTPACSAGYFRTGCSSHYENSVMGNGVLAPSSAIPSGAAACICRRGTGTVHTFNCYNYCAQ